MDIIENKTIYSAEDVIQIAHRENNKKRSYLLVNPIQAKHIPVSPDKPFKLFSTLGKAVSKHYKHKRVCVIGFAETATAIGACVAIELGENTFYIHTTRENIKGTNIAVFEEEHSHAVEQKLFCNNPEALSESDIILFVEDELTTGRTILNFIRTLRKNGYINETHELAVASLINGMNNENLEIYKRMGVEFHYLFKINYEHNKNTFADITLNHQKKLFSSLAKFETDTSISYGKLDPRIGVKIGDYKSACEKFASLAVENYDFTNKKVLVLGTEEFMYPAILIAYKLFLNYTKDVKVHSTTRSPIIAYSEKNYPIHNRSELISFYDKERKTFVYNLDKYDKVLIVTDSKIESNMGIESLTKQLQFYGCKDISLNKWVE